MGAPPADRPPGSRYERPGRIPYWITALGLRFLVRAYLRVRVEGVERLPPGPSILCFNHQSWLDPFVLIAALPARPDIVFFGPREADMSVGARNRLITWSGRGVPFHPDRGNLLDTTRRVQAVLESGTRLAIAPEGRIHAGERTLLPISEGVAFFALRTRVPIVPMGFTGLGWVHLGRTVRVRIGDPIIPEGPATRGAVRYLTGRVASAMLDLVADGRDVPPPGPVGRWITELFNDWPEGGRPAPSSPGEPGSAPA